jgi:3-deoxy-D-manno-octulosonic-acid transferase
MMLALYQAAMAAFEPLAPAILRGRVKRGKEDPARVRERLGYASVARPEGRLVWLHGVSVGESLSLLPLIARIRAERPDLGLLVTSGTATSASLLAKRLPQGVVHQFVPVDGPKAVDRFLGHWRPDLALFAESELWPNLILGLQERGARLGLVSARITERTTERWLRRPKTAKALFSAFDLILPQDAASAERLGRLGASAGPILNLKHVGDPLPHDPAELGRLRMAAAGRKVVVAASTHPEEERLIAEAMPPGPILVVVPRHPDRGGAVAADLAALGRRVSRRSSGEPMSNRADIHLADTLGELGLFFRLADLVIMGGSLVTGIGGHNPLEPARLGKGVVSGPHVHNFDDVYGELGATGGAMILDAQDLGSAAALLELPEKLAAMGKAAQTYADGLRNQFETGWTRIQGMLP